MEVSDTPPESRWRWEAWERLASRIDARVGVPGDSDTRRFQKVLVVVVAFIGSIATLFNAPSVYRFARTPTARIPLFPEKECN